ncbi:MULTISPECIES: 23S rRNA (uracil(1939)-C(5))-methyltransferase RlmD [Pseudomonas]|jgi:23S rRNA (uracil1939-C5)-methyltransferase|uniref:23S rRNA (uracil(1939)-C(5))-methyltransferase RlmD n=2 Tax=Pseudomonas juntendi TaxID=2666183 RepID=A0A7W2R1C0_9PSED|nr:MULTISPECIES: 23S rRNA (uracil(1939)-C(5))-methyltransferase RlmD [Pseudomonas]NPA18837.1 23S rRNA (uracil(1939)-C(5))-methyltransferase RlmD [Gammaproteobacteria bacterium]OAK59382.1 23S rRNA (uracil(1939)-C(5))-methyltransferase [Pseudomonas putida]PPB15588.1 23S rRNA (uracil(1939)-C(5))-methyltransferase RlmD [Pseudomonas aeruginosa]MBA6124011.1 23S rRNA (uracil(1939)-C(5))-methyltransferase RlmD [Pseudomonas juntendi]MBA6134934.1 23S rRNA (uracil(1939)-C(5))-methyltransferase RlmD [Pseu
MTKKKTSSGLRFQPAGGSRSPQVPVGKKQRLDIERLAGDGRGIAFHEGRTWFVSGALAGEAVEARVLNARGKVVEARLERVLQASPERREAPCRHYSRCGGCTLQHLPHEAQLALKQRTLAEQLQRVAGVQPDAWAPPLSGPAFGYRRRARVAVRWDVKARQLQVGFRAEASQDIIAIDDCPVLVQPLQSILRHLPTVLRSLEKPQALGHVELFSGSAEALLVRHVAPLPAQDLARLQAFCEQANAQLWLQGEGEPAPVEPAAPLGFALAPWQLELAWRPGDFVQVNAQVNTAMIEQALAWLAPQADERVLDLFCGLGNFALPLARQAREVVAVEGVQAMVDRAAANARNNNVHNARFFQADLSQPLAGTGWAAEGFSAVLLDPPRDGAYEVVQGIARLKASRLVYVSCNPATLARDAQVLAGQGYRLTRAGILDMFPQTAHVEAMALFEAG